MFSILFVTAKPPTTLIIANVTAMKARIPDSCVFPPSKATFAPSSAPTMLIPEIAFAPLIKGVWSVAGTLVINSKPKKMDKMNNAMLPSKSSGDNALNLMPPLA